MIIYNVTISVENEIHDNWIHWMKEDHIPKVMACGIFKTAQLNKVLTQEDSGQTYAIAYSCNSMKDLHQYQVQYAAVLQKEHVDMFGEKALAFRTLMEVVKVF